VPSSYNSGENGPHLNPIKLVILKLNLFEFKIIYLLVKRA
jgi:hypothetical protein